MKITYTARKVNLRDNFKDRVEKKLKKFDKIFSDDAQAFVVVTVDKSSQTVEITIKDNHMVYRAEKTMPEMNDAVDKCVDVLGRQLRKNKARLENASDRALWRSWSLLWTSLRSRRITPSCAPRRSPSSRSPLTRRSCR